MCAVTHRKCNSQTVSRRMWYILQLIVANFFRMCVSKSGFKIESRPNQSYEQLCVIPGAQDIDECVATFRTVVTSLGTSGLRRRPQVIRFADYPSLDVNHQDIDVMVLSPFTRHCVCSYKRQSQEKNQSVNNLRTYRHLARNRALYNYKYISPFRPPV